VSENAEKEANIYDFIDYTVIDTKYGNIGKVRKIIDIQNNPLMVVLYDETDILIPKQNDFIISLDKRKREIHINTPDGLIELFLK
jgi:16S rRNA processing protein RimM